MKAFCNGCSLSRVPSPLQRGDLVRTEVRDRHHAGAHGRAVDEHRAGAALRTAATEFRAIELEIVARTRAEVYQCHPCDEAPRYLIRDRDRAYGAAFTHRLRAMGIRDKPIAPGSPWQNGFAERPIGSIRRECVDHIVVLGEAHLRRILTKYAAYYNELRTHRSLGKDAPISRAIQHVGRIISGPVLGGLHHHYCRI